MMILRAQVTDGGTGQAVPNAVIYTQDAAGNAVGVGRSNELGNFTAPVSENNPTILVAASGYAPIQVDTGEISDTGNIQMTPQALAAGQATTVIPNTTASSVPWWVWVAGVGLVLYSTETKKSKKIGDGASSYILPVGIVIAGYFILSKLGVFGDTAGDKNAASINDTTLQGAADSLANAQAAGDPITISRAEAATIASTVFNAGTADPVDMDTIQNQVIQANSLSDLLLIIQAFGTKSAGGTACSLFGNILSSTCATYTLPSFLRATLDPSHMQAVNGYFSSMGINYQF
jgi:uncharacterized membrane protein YdcZ (DUF606 family)